MNLLDLLYIPVAVVTAPKWAGKKRQGWAERFGRTPAFPPPSTARPRLLIHAVSVGEVAALRHLIPLLTPTHDVAVSATTDTGLARAHDLYSSTCRVLRFPLDFSASVRRFLDSVRPDAVALVELEVWPNFIAACARRRIPVCVINGRLSERSFRGYRRIARFLAPTFRRLAFAAVQDETYASRFEALGVAPGDVLLTGSMKWDAATITDDAPGADELARILGIDRSRPLIVAGSTGPDDARGEEALLHAACPPGVQLLCAPRKPERFDEAAAAMPGRVRRSQHSPENPAPKGAARFLLDSIGELRKAYALADAVVIGRSFGRLYGSDPIEPIALGKPTAIGPAVKDFESVVAALDRHAGILRTTRQALAADLARLIADPTLRATLARNGRACIRREQGASERTAAALAALAPPRPGTLPDAATSPSSLGSVGV